MQCFRMHGTSNAEAVGTSLSNTDEGLSQLTV